MGESYDIVLASASPRRRELLAKTGVAFRVHAVDADESLSAELAANPVEAVATLAERKARAAVERLDAPAPGTTLVVIGSDTMVVHAGEIFGKPRDAVDAQRMLRALSGDVHDVHTAVSLWELAEPPSGRPHVRHRTFVDTTRVFFRDLDDAEIDAYIASGDPFDKAGAYGIQGAAGAFVDHIEGALSTVIGFPVERLAREFPAIFA